MAGKLDPRRALEKLLAPVLYERLRPAGRNCPDAGILAAYYAHSLSPDETKEWELHFSTCFGCQAALASLARLEVEGARGEDERSARRWIPDWRGSWKWAAPAALAASAVLALVTTLRNREVIDEATRRAVESEPAEAPTIAELPVAPADRAAETPLLAATATAAPLPTTAPTAPPTEVPPTPAPASAAPPEAFSAAMPNRRSVMPLAAKEADREGVTVAIPAGSVLIGSESDFRVVWRVGRAGAIERSNDGGRSWTAQRSGVAVDLAAGSAPSSTVCWVVGRRGTVLRTTDGQRWQRVTPPSTEDLVRVRAGEAETATVYSASGRRFVTNDGGQTWRSL